MSAKGRRRPRLLGMAEVAIIEFEKALALDSNLNFNPETEAAQLAMPGFVSEGDELAQKGVLVIASIHAGQCTVWQYLSDLFLNTLGLLFRNGECDFEFICQYCVI